MSYEQVGIYDIKDKKFLCSMDNEIIKFPKQHNPQIHAISIHTFMNIWELDVTRYTIKEFI